MKRNTVNIILAGGLILLAVAARIVNAEMKIYHLAPVAALGLFAGSIVKDKKFAYIFALLAMFISDLYIELFSPWDGFYGVSQVFTYGGMALVTLLGTKMKQPRALKVLGFSLAGSAIFFIVSNIGVWLQGWYGTDFAGLVKTFTMALPFYTKQGQELFINSFVGDLLFNGLLFGSYALLTQAIYGKLTKAKA